MHQTVETSLDLTAQIKAGVKAIGGAIYKGAVSVYNFITGNNSSNGILDAASEGIPTNGMPPGML